MFVEIYKEIRKFLKGPIINHHNKPVPPLLKIFLEKTDNIKIDSSCFYVQSEDSKRFYIQIINDVSEENSSYAITILFDGKPTNIVMTTKLMEEYTVKEIMKIVIWILYYTISTLNPEYEFEYIHHLKKLYLPVLYCVMVKNIFKDSLTVNDIYSVYNNFVEKRLQSINRDNENNKVENPFYFRFITKEFFEVILEKLDDFLESNINNTDEPWENFIYKYLDCSFIIIDKEIISKYENTIRIKDWED